ncbi:MAG: dTMP kinase [Eubacterium sp.]|jgi:dTMP kinase|nr:dTMP kinase [Eubacterium sp.]
MAEKTGKFIVFEGLDGCGKSTQLENLRKRLSTLCKPAGKRKVFITREPSDSVPGLICRGISKKNIDVQHETETLLFAADRYEHIVSEILPQVRAGNHVICDRFYLSNFAYQSLETDFDTILQYNLAAIELITPDITVFIDVHPEECERRRSIERAVEEKYENVERAKVIRERYILAIEFLKDRSKEVLFINGEGDPDQIFEDLWSNELSQRVFTKDDYN